jgi:hypothetical protein
MESKPQRSPSGLRAALFGVLAVVVVAGGLAISVLGWLRHSNLRSVQQLASPHLSCPPKRIEVVEEQVDIEESYRVAGCGKRGRVRCAPQDPKCSFVAE